MIPKVLMEKTDKKELRLAILVDCENVAPEIMAYAMSIATRLGRSVIRRAYGNAGTLTHKWQSVLVNLAFTPYLQYPYATGKNTSDMALALDALEIGLERRTDAICIVSSDSDFTHLCRKLREYGVQIYGIGDAQTPMPLRHACDQFFEWTRPTPTQTAPAKPKITPSTATAIQKSSPPTAKQPPPFLLAAISQLASKASDSKVLLNALGTYLKQHHPEFTPKQHGYAGLLKMLKSFNSFQLHQEKDKSTWQVSLSK